MVEALATLRALNRAVALIAGGAVLLAAAFIILDISLRQAGASFGGTDEISGYVMAAITVWGFSYALLERAHVRIDMVRNLTPRPIRALLDLLAMTALSYVAIVVAFRAWPVLERSIANGSRANTPLETPLWIPQAIWFGGLLWFGVMASLVTLLGYALIIRGQFANSEAAIGPTGEGD
ncbi:MAG: TRAP transporter small permease [Pseudomonadota bacterium]